MAREELKAITNFLNASGKLRGRLYMTPDGVVYCQGLLTIDIPEDQVLIYYKALRRREAIVRECAEEEKIVLDWEREYLSYPLEKKYLVTVDAGRKLDEADAVECETE